MIIVEFYSNFALDNLVSTLANTPELVIFVGEGSQKETCEHTFQCLCDMTGNRTTKTEYRAVNVRQLSKIVNVLDDIVQSHENCQFDLTGGNELCLVAAGIIFERYGAQKLDLHQYNIKTGRVYDCDMDGDVVSSSIPSLTVEQTIKLHGGSIIPYTVRENGHYPWDFDDDFCRDIRAMWDINKTDCGQWNRQISILSDMQEFLASRRGVAGTQFGEDDLAMDVPLQTFRNYYEANRNESLRLNTGARSVFRRLSSRGLISDLHCDDTSLRLTFKNRQVKRCLAKAGTLLELYTCLVAKELTDKDGSPYFHDIMTGVFIDWDGKTHANDGSGQVDTENEIDVVLMHGLIPVFISCKNGAVGDAELYKLATVTERFGGPYAKRVLAGTTLGNTRNAGPNSEATRSILHLYDRAKVMDTKIIEGIHNMTEAEFGAQLKDLVK